MTDKEILEALKTKEFWAGVWAGALFFLVAIAIYLLVIP